MATDTYFDQLRKGLLNKKWIAIPLLILVVLVGGAKMYKDLVSVVPTESQPSKTAAGLPSIEAQASARTLVERELRPIYFRDRNPDMPPEAIAQIDNYSRLLAKASYRHLLIEGHTGALNPKPNVDLGRERAFAVADALIKSGVPPEKLIIVPFGGEESQSSPAPAYRERVSFRVEWQ